MRTELPVVEDNEGCDFHGYDADTLMKSSPEPVEMKSKGVKLQSSQISPGFTREIDGIVVFPHSNQINIGINPFLTDYEGYLDQYRLPEPGRYALKWVVFSDNFRPTRRRFVVSIGNDMRIINFRNE